LFLIIMEKNNGNKETGDCIFCKIINGEIECKRVYEDDNFIAFFDIKPKADGHTLIVPKKHFKTILDIPSSLGVELLDAIKKVSLDLISCGKGEGVNVVINVSRVAGQLVDHAHVHIIPRKKDDGLKMIV